MGQCFAGCFFANRTGCGSCTGCGHPWMTVCTRIFNRFFGSRCFGCRFCSISSRRFIFIRSFLGCTLSSLRITFNRFFIFSIGITAALCRLNVSFILFTYRACCVCLCSSYWRIAAFVVWCTAIRRRLLFRVWRRIVVIAQINRPVGFCFPELNIRIAFKIR